MAETLYRRTPEGFLEPAVPVAAGKAAAATRFLSQGGGMTDESGMMPGDKRTRGGQVTRKGRVVKGGAQPGKRYTAGPMAGMTQAQAENEFENRWQGASAAIKDKYAARARNSLAPSEQAAPTPAVPARAPVPGMQMPTAKPSMFADLTKAPVMTAGGLTSVGDGSTAENGWTPQPRPGSRMPTKPDLSGVGTMASVGNSFERAAVADEKATGQAPFSLVGAATVTAPYQAPITSPADARRADEARVAAMRRTTPQAPTPAPVAMTSAAPVAQPAAAPMTPATPAKMASDTAYSAIADQRKAVGYSPIKPVRINSQTGLPFGYLPGDSVAPEQAGAAAESVARQSAASAAAIPRAVPVKSAAAPMSAPARYSEAQEGYQESQLDPNKREEMRETYANASGLDKARITANSLKRGAGLMTAARPVRR